MEAAIQFAQLAVLVLAACGATYWGGQMKRTTDTLCQVTQDHEQRLRHLERD